MIGVLAACRSQPQRVEELTVWQPRGKWTGRADQQTDPFISTTGLLRLTWEARATTATGNPSASLGAGRQTADGRFRIILHSDVSGRPLLVAVDRQGPAKDVTYVTEDPRSFFLAVESEGLEWTIEVAEGLPASRR